MIKPSTVDVCMLAFSEVLSPEDRADIVSCSEEDLIQYHHGLGRWIRNNWDLWKGGPLKEHMLSLGFIHPDDMSQALIEEYWNRLHNKPSQLAKRAQESQEYWAKKENQ